MSLKPDNTGMGFPVFSDGPTGNDRDRSNNPWLDSWMMQMETQWNERNGIGKGGMGPRAFLTREQVMQETLDTVSRVFSAGGDPYGSSDGVPTAAAISQQIAGVQDLVRRSLIYQALENTIGDLDLGSLETRMQSITESSVAAIATEEYVRTSKDNAIAAAINTIWGAMGGASAVIQDGQLASVTPSGTSATKWLQVTAAVTDPNTGLVNSTSIKQDLNSYASAANGTFNSIYSVRAQIDVYGRTVVGGFGLSATSGAGSAGGGTIAFGVRADQFFIAPTSGTPDGTTQENQGNSIPFMALTVPQYVNGILYPAGVFIKQATIGDATIGTAKIADASITNAKIGYAIQSNNWDGNNGWYIDKGGTAYFLNVIARGNILATSVAANVIYADQIVSDSLNRFFATGGGSVNFTVNLGAAAVKVSASPGFYSGSGGGKDPGSPVVSGNVVRVLINGGYYGQIVGSGTFTFYGLGPGNHTFQFTNGNGTTYTGLVEVQVIVR